MTSTSTSTSTSNDSGRLVTGLFPDRASAEAAYGTASARGYSKDDVNLVMSDETRTRHFADDSSAKNFFFKSPGEGRVPNLRWPRKSPIKHR